MSAKVDKFCNSLRERLNAIEARAESIKANVESMPGKAEKAVQSRINDVRALLHSQKERIEKSRTDLQEWAGQKKAESEATIQEWKTKREVRKLVARADRAEAYAEAAACVALGMIDEAEEALLQAALARMDANSAQ